MSILKQRGSGRSSICCFDKCGHYLELCLYFIFPFWIYGRKFCVMYVMVGKAKVAKKAKAKKAKIVYTPLSPMTELEFAVKPKKKVAKKAKVAKAKKAKIVYTPLSPMTELEFAVKVKPKKKAAKKAKVAKAKK